MSYVSMELESSSIIDYKKMLDDTTKTNNEDEDATDSPMSRANGIADDVVEISENARLMYENNIKSVSKNTGNKDFAEKISTSNTEEIVKEEKNVAEVAIEDAENKIEKLEQEIQELSFDNSEDAKKELKAKQIELQMLVNTIVSLEDANSD